ncbi:MAG: hypothetical protein JWP58_2182 [Hymenobacter sp.]|nr:hypothetical protein [Hymenobacter sp.]
MTVQNNSLDPMKKYFLLVFAVITPGPRGA